LSSPSLYPPLEPYAQGRLAVSDLHSLYWEVSGNPNGLPVIFLHGGPGGGTVPKHRQFFDPEKYRIVLFDQRGAGRSTPLAELQNNTTQDLIADIEQLRILLQVEAWLVFGGSWGSTLAIAYGEAHPERCLGFILRGIFLGRNSERDWFLRGMRHFFPEHWADFVRFLPPEERSDLLGSYYARLCSPDLLVSQSASQSWANYEAKCASLLPKRVETPAVVSKSDIAIATIEAHYMVHDCFLADNQLLGNLEKIKHLPCTIVQGRYDVVCPPVTAYELHRQWLGSKLVVTPDAGHSAFELSTQIALVEACDEFSLPL
jgi:proline iminopeptidase